MANILPHIHNSVDETLKMVQGERVLFSLSLSFCVRHLTNSQNNYMRNYEA